MIRFLSLVRLIKFVSLVHLIGLKRYPYRVIILLWISHKS